MGAPAPGGNEGDMSAPEAGSAPMGAPTPGSMPDMSAPAGREKRESVDYSRRLGILLNSKKK
jgi:hypothetical protein